MPEQTASKLLARFETLTADERTIRGIFERRVMDEPFPIAVLKAHFQVYLICLNALMKRHTDRRPDDAVIDQIGTFLTARAQIQYLIVAPANLTDPIYGQSFGFVYQAWPHAVRIQSEHAPSKPAAGRLAKKAQQLKTVLPGYIRQAQESRELNVPLKELLEVDRDIERAICLILGPVLGNEFREKSTAAIHILRQILGRYSIPVHPQ